MSADYPYVMTVSKFRDFVRKLQAAGIPERVDIKYLKSLGFTSAHDTEFRRPLEFLELIDGSGATTPRYVALREGTAGKRKLGEYIREAYAALFKMHGNAYQKDAEALRDFFRAHSKVGDLVVGRMVATFQVLCEFASFEEAAPAEEVMVPEKTVSGGANSGGATTPPAVAVNTTPVIINVNIQLSIPPTTDSEVYDKLFASMAKHIKVLRGDSTSGNPQGN